MFGSLWKRIFGGKPGVPAQDNIAADHDPLTALHEQVRRDVASGFYDEDAILTNAHDAFEEELPKEVLRREASATLRQALADHQAAEAGWPEITDCDRLDAAFAALEAKGVVSRQNFTCCGTCGSTEIWDEIDDAQDSGRPIHGYAFFHMQDTEAAVDGYGLYLNYGACDQDEEAALTIGHAIVDELEAHGLQTGWDGSWNQRIQVSLNWQKRRGLSAVE